MYCADQPLSSPKGPSSFTMMTAHCATEPYFRLPAEHCGAGMSSMPNVKASHTSLCAA